MNMLPNTGLHVTTERLVFAEATAFELYHLAEQLTKTTLISHFTHIIGPITYFVLQFMLGQTEPTSVAE